MTKKELQAALISQIRHYDKDLNYFSEKESLDDWLYVLGQQSGLKLVLELVDCLDEVRKETGREVISWILNHIDVYAYFDQIMNFFAEKYDNDGVKVVEDERE